MNSRIGSVAFLLGSVATGISWLTLQPVLIRLLEAIRKFSGASPGDVEALERMRGLLPFYLALDVLAVMAACYVVLQWAVGRPLRRAEETIDQLSRLDLELPIPPGGPLMSRLQGALSRMAGALRQEQALTKRQLAELRQTNQALVLAQTELVSSERLATVGRLAAGIAHEVGNPLSGILGYLSVVKQRAGSSTDVADLLQRTEAEVLRIDQIVRGLLDLGRPSTGQLAPVEVERVARSCVQLALRGPEFTGVKVSVAIEPGIIARAESGPLSQVLLNLLLNAAQAMNGTGTIALSARRDGDRVVIDVRDTGPGIPIDVLPRVFEPFFTTKGGGKGTGLGLAISAHLVAAMGGQLTASNLDGGGALFSLRLPAA